MPYPSCVEVIIIWLCAHPSCVEEIIVLALCLASCVKVVVGERSCVLLTLYITKSSVEISYVGGPMWTYSENHSV